MTILRRYKEQGATALIVVVFSILLLMTVSIGFMRLVIQDQDRTENDELSRGAYDSALAGVEDGKRALKACISDGSAVACDAISNNRCNTIHAAKILSDVDSDANNDPVVIQNSTGVSGGFEQAYTCVKINRNTTDYQAPLAADTSTIVPLQTESQFSDIGVSWFLRTSTLRPIDLDAAVGNLTLPTSGAWTPTSGSIRPPLLRVQLMQYNQGNFQLSDFDDNGNEAVLYLYPKSSGASSLDFAVDGRRTDGNNLLRAVACEASPFATTTSNYVCSVRIKLPQPQRAVDESTRQAYLRVTSIYGDTDISVSAYGTKLVDVQPAIDSTGRASDVYRRIKARVELVSPVNIYPRATVDMTNNFCKNFSVSATQYYNDNTCDYNQPTTP